MSAASVAEGERSTEAEQRSGKVIVIAFALLAAATALYFALGMPGMDHGSDRSMVGMDMEPSSPHRVVDPATFEQLLDDSSTTVINVHVPYEGEIDGTDLNLPFNALSATRLPPTLSTQLLIYCETGRMSTIAAATLVELGYANIVELDGGMQAWRSSGRRIESAG